MAANINSDGSKMDGKRFSGLQVFGLIVVAIIITAMVTILVFKTYFIQSEFKPVTLSSQEEQVLTAKLEKLDSMGDALKRKDIPDKRIKSDRLVRHDTLEPEPPSEKKSKGR